MTEAPRPAGAALTELSDEALSSLVAEHGGKAFQARQLAHWVFRHGAADWAGCRNVPAGLKQRLDDAGFCVRSSRVIHVEPSSDGTEKLLLELADGETVETVLIPEGERMTLCISSQVGCPVACVFCASGLDGVRRNLQAGEIVEQVLHARDRLIARGDFGHAPARITNLVVMGLGEPMLNLRAVTAALDRISDPEGIGLGARRVTVSTSGLPDRMRRFAETSRAYGLAVSLHAADDALRRQLVPTARASVSEIVEAARAFFSAKGREVTFEVVLLAGVNDRKRDADALIDALSGLPSTVNLIPWNPVDRIEGLARPTEASVDLFAELLRRGGLNVTVRRQRGADRSAACGQLRLRRID
ncbi:MAG: 23S rRNA (adenine(2503)-C(2))-methyltransferase RlmN, partial [Planctomycetota bacterium]|nr:23S rRNA (adenine(2503)-C(2))-methyltransferase RlmN [Planctomycetota bacterium]